MTRHFDDLQLGSIEMFCLAAELSSFTAAANAAGVTPAAVSRSVSRLEARLGIRLFVRSTRNIELSTFGKLFETFARHTLFETEAALKHLQDYAAGRIGKVHVAALPSVAANWLPPVFQRFRAQFPGVTTALTDGMSQQCVELLSNGEIDFAVATADHYAANLDRELLWTDSLHLVCPANHPLARQRRRIGLDQIARYPIVNFVKHSSVRQRVDAAFGPHALNTVLEVEHLATASAMVESGVGLTVVPSLTLYQFNRPSLVIRAIEGSDFKREVFIFSRRHKALSQPARVIREMLVQHVRNLGRKQS